MLVFLYGCETWMITRDGKVHQCVCEGLTAEDVTGALLLTHHKQTSARTDGEICWQARTSADRCKKKKFAVIWKEELVGQEREEDQ